MLLWVTSFYETWEEIVAAHAEFEEGAGLRSIFSDSSRAAITCRVGLPFFEKKKNSAEQGRGGNSDSIRQNSVCSTERKMLGILFGAIPWKIKKFGIPFRTISRKIKGSEFRSEPFRRREKHLEFCSVPLKWKKKVLELAVVFAWCFFDLWNKKSFLFSMFPIPSNVIF